MNDRLNFIVRKSVAGSKEKPKTLINFKVKQKTLAKIAAAILVFLLVADLAYNLISTNIQQKKAIEKSRIGIESVLEEGKEVGQYDVKNNKSRIDFVNQDDVKDYIKSTAKNDHIEIFDAYTFYLEQDLGDVALRNVMDRLIAEMQITDCKTFEDYVIKCGFGDSEGKADYKAYKSYMGMTTVKFQELQEMLEEKGMGGLS